MKNGIAKVNELLQKQNLDAVLISSVPNIIYLTNYSGFSKDEREAFLIITKTKNYLLTDGRYAEAVKEIQAFSLIKTSPSLSFQQAFKQLLSKHAIKRIGIEENDITIREYEKLKKHLNDIYHLSNSIINLRLIKKQAEIDHIKKACQLGDRAFEYILPKIKKGVSEKEVAFEIEVFIKKQGADLSFPSIIAFGSNSAIPHHQTSNRRLKENEIVLLDFGVKIKNYCSDMTRTIFFGKAPDEFKKMYQTVLTAQQKAIDHLASSFNHLPSGSKGVKASRVDQIARNHITSNGHPSIPHSLGHGIGIEVHEPPFLSPKSKDFLKPGMVFSIEPGIYVPGFGGVRIEDLVVLEKSGPRLLTHSPKNLIEI